MRLSLMRERPKCSWPHDAPRRHALRRGMRNAAVVGAVALLFACSEGSAAPVGTAAGGMTAGPTTGSAGGGTGGMGGGAGGLGGSVGVGGAGGSGGSGLPLNGFGTLVGDCDQIESDELVEMSAPMLLNNTIDFGTMMVGYDDLSVGGKALFDAGNLNQGSLYSEIFAYEVLYRCELAALLKTETTIVYDIDGKKTDLLVEMDGAKVGVSVTRGFHFPTQDPYTVAMAEVLLNDKLSDILESTANVAAEDAWQKQVLHVLAFSQEHVDSINAAYGLIDPMVLGDTIVVVTLTDGDDAFMY